MIVNCWQYFDEPIVANSDGWLYTQPILGQNRAVLGFAASCGDLIDHVYRVSEPSIVIRTKKIAR